MPKHAPPVTTTGHLVGGAGKTPVMPDISKAKGPKQTKVGGSTNKKSKAPNARFGK